MALRVRCPGCDQDITVADDARGQRLRCKECGEVFTADEGRRERRAAMREEDDDRPRRPRRRYEDDDDEPPPRRRSSGNTAVWLAVGIVGGSVLLVLACCGGFGMLAYQASQNPPPPVVVNPPVNNPPPVVVVPPAAPPVAVPRAAPAWDVKADPVPRPPVKVVNADRRAQLGGDFPYILTAPATPSPFLLSGTAGNPRQKQEVWNLETMEKTGHVTGFAMTGPGHLSPDGAYVANRLNDVGTPIVVVACQDSTKAFQLGMGDLSPVDFYDFAGPRRLVVVGNHGCHVFEVPSGRKVRQFETASKHQEGTDALSGGGKYLAFQSGDAVLLYDLDQGRAAGQFAIPAGWNAAEHRELAFSPDGTELAVLFEGKGRVRVFTWDLIANRLGVDYTLAPSVVRGLRTPERYLGPRLEWLGDGSGWLLRGELLIDKRSGAPAWRMDLSGTELDFARHVVGSTHVARAYGFFAKEGLGLVEIRRGEFAAAPRKPGPAQPPAAGAPGPAKPPAAGGPALVPWVVKPDPLPAGLTLPQKAEGTIAITAPSHGPNNVVNDVIFPTSPSPFVSVAAKGPIYDAHEIWDLRSMKKVGRVEPEDPFTTAALSPDGAYWAKPNFMLKGLPGADVYAVADGRHFRITVTNDKSTVIENVDFAGPGELVTMHGVSGKDGTNVVVKVWDVKKQALVLGFGAPGSLDRNQRAFSPGRRYIALANSQYDRVLLCDLKGGHRAGELPLPAGSKCLGLAFSPDGQSLAGLFRIDNSTRILAWNLDAGTGSAHLMLDPAAVPKVSVYQGPALEWLPEGDGWLLYGRALVDRKSGAVYWRLPAEDRDWTPRHVLPGGRVAYVKGSGKERALVVEPLPAEAEAARQAGRHQ